MGILVRRATLWLWAALSAAAAADCARAAEHAERQGLPARALELFRRGAGLYASAGSDDAAFELRWRAGRLAVLWDSADLALSDADHLLSVATTDRQRAQALVLRAQARIERHETAALEDADAAWSLAVSCGDADLRRLALLRRAGGLYVQGRWGEAMAVLDAVASDAGGELSPAEQGELEDLRWPLLAALGRRHEAVAGALAARDRALGAGHWQRAAEMVSHAGVQLCYLGETTRAIEACEQAIALCARIGADRGSIHVDQMTLAGLYLDAGRFADALRLGEAAAAGIRSAGLTSWVANVEHCQATMFMVLGRHDLAARHLAALPSDAPTWTRAARAMMVGVLQHRRTGRSPLEQLQRAQSLLAEGGAITSPFVQHRIAAEVAAWSPVQAALPMLAEGEAWAEAHAQVALRRMIRRIRVDVLLAAGRAGDAAEAAEALEADFDGRWEAVNFYLPEVWATLARAWDGVGDRPRADALVDQACTWIDARLQHDVPPAFADSFRGANRVNGWLQRRRRPAGPASRWHHGRRVSSAAPGRAQTRVVAPGGWEPPG